MLIVYHESAVNYFGVEYLEIAEHKTIKFHLSNSSRVNFNFNSMKDAVRAFAAILEAYKDGKPICDLSGFTSKPKGEAKSDCGAISKPA